MNGYQINRLWAYFSVKNNPLKNYSSKIKRCLEMILRANTVSRCKMVSVPYKDFSLLLAHFST